MRIRARLLRPPSAAWGAYLRGDGGSATILGVIVFLMMVLAGGVAIDFMRVEAKRAKLQYTLDRAVLAAGSLSQGFGETGADRQAIVEEYLAAAGLGGIPVSIDVTSEHGLAKVTATSNAPVKGLFVHMLGIERLVAPARSVAGESASSMEIVLVLDVSGSMASRSTDSGRSKIAELREAARAFVSEVLTDRDGSVLVSIVPYDHNVNLGSVLSQQITLANSHDHSRCPRFEASDYRTTAVPDGSTFRRITHFDQDNARNDLQVWRKLDGDGRVEIDDNTGQPKEEVFYYLPDPGPIREPQCHVDDTNAVLAWSNDVARLQNHIDRLVATPGANTAIQDGMKVGSALLDPSSRSRLSDMIDDRHVDERFRPYPTDFGSRGVRKVIVVMTDGHNTYQTDVANGRLGEPSRVYVYHDDFKDMTLEQRRAYALADPDDKDFVYSIFDPGTGDKQYWVYKRAKIEYEDDGTVKKVEPSELDDKDEPEGKEHAYQLTIGELFSVKTFGFVYNEFAQRLSSEGKSWFSSMLEQYALSRQADQYTSDICAVARSNGIAVFAVGFQTTARGEAVMKNCATSVAHYYEVEGSDSILSAFQDVARVTERLSLVE